MRNKILGMFLGTPIGDILGLPYETMEFGTYERVTNYNGLPPQWSDDTQLTLAVANSLIESLELNLQSQAKWHVKAYQDTTFGWGSTTKYCCRKLMEGVSPTKMKYGQTKGNGNGVAMKSSPIAAYIKISHKWPLSPEMIKKIIKFSSLTHHSSVAAQSSLVQIAAVMYCLSVKPEDFSSDKFVEEIVFAANIDEENLKPLTASPDLTERLKIVDRLKDSPSEAIVDVFGGGTSYVYNSLPFSYAFFLQNPHSIESLYNVISAGGDTDTNGAIVGCLLGALHGNRIFPDHLITGIPRLTEINNIAKMFCDKFNIEEGENIKEKTWRKSLEK